MSPPLKGHKTHDGFYTLILYRFSNLCIQKSNCWTDRTICLNKTDANVGEYVRAYIHAYVQMISVCLLEQQQQ